MRANVLLTRTTGGESAVSCQVKFLPESNRIPEAARYSGEIEKLWAEKSSFQKSVVPAGKTDSLPQQPSPKIVRSIMPTAETPGIRAVSSNIRFCTGRNCSSL